MAIAASSPSPALANSAGGFGVGHIGRAGNHGAIGDERIVNGGGGAVAFKAADVAAIAGAAVDVNGDVSDFGGGTEEAVDEATVVDDAEAHAFADQIIGEVASACTDGSKR